MMLKCYYALLSRREIEGRPLLQFNIISCDVQENVMDSSSDSTHNGVVSRLIEEMEAKQKLIPREKVNLKDCIGQGQYNCAFQDQ